MTVTRTYRFHEVFEEEVRAINQRRRRYSLRLFLSRRITGARQGGRSQERRLPLHGVGRRLHWYLALRRDEPFEGGVSIHREPDPGRAVLHSTHPQPFQLSVSARDHQHLLQRRHLPAWAARERTAGSALVVVFCGYHDLPQTGYRESAHVLGRDASSRSAHCRAFWCESDCALCVYAVVARLGTLAIVGGQRMGRRNRLTFYGGVRACSDWSAGYRVLRTATARARWHFQIRQ